MSIEEIVKDINTNLPLHSMWDGFWVNYFHRNTLIISCSFDRWYGRNYDVIFKKVIFFNVPERWRDIQIHSHDLLRLATPEEFWQQNPDFDIQGRSIFAIDMYIELCQDIMEYGQIVEMIRPVEQFTFYILARHVYLIPCTPEDTDPEPEYVDRFADERPYPCMKNRVLPKNPQIP